MEEKLQRNADRILALQDQHRCDRVDHQRENRGYCYVKPNGDHLPLSKAMLADWAEEWVSTFCAGTSTPTYPASLQGIGNVTKLHPPNTAMFSKSASVHKPRGASTASNRDVPPIQIHVPSPSAPAGSGSDISAATNAMLLTAVMKVMERLAGDPAAAPATPTVTASAAPTGSSPAPSAESLEAARDIASCLELFRSRNGIDILQHVEFFKQQDITPQTIASLQLAELRQLLPSLSIGHAIALRSFVLSLSG